MGCLVNIAIAHGEVLPTPYCCSERGGVGDLEQSLLTSPYFLTPIPGLRQLLSCHLIDKALGRPLSLLFLSKRTPRAHFPQDPAQKKAVLLFSGWWFLSYRH